MGYLYKIFISITRLHGALGEALVGLKKLRLQEVGDLMICKVTVKANREDIILI